MYDVNTRVKSRGLQDALYAYLVHHSAFWKEARITNIRFIMLVMALGFF